MVNVNKVKTPDQCSECAHFCVFLLVSGRFLHFKNPVKYKRMFEINQTYARRALFFLADAPIFRLRINHIARLT